MATVVVLIPENARDVAWLTAVQLRTSGIKEIHFTQEQRSVVYSGLLHSTLGNASLTLLANDSELVVGNLGSSGQDGVTVALPPNGRWDAQWLPLDAGVTLPAGAFLQSTVIGSLDGTTDQPIGVVTAKKLATEGYGLTADFASLGSKTFSADVYNGSQLVGHAAGLGGNIGVSSIMPKDIHLWCCPLGGELTWRGGGSTSGTLIYPCRWDKGEWRPLGADP